MPVPDAGIRPTNSATPTTARITKKSRMVWRDLSRFRLWRSIILTPMTIRIAASAATGTQAIKLASSRKATSASTPSITPESRLTAPLDMLTSVAPIVPAPGMPPTSPAARLPRPCPTSSRFELCRERVRASSTTQVFSVSIESSTDRVSAGTSKAFTCVMSRCFMASTRPAKAAARSPPIPPPLPPPMGPTISRLPSITSSEASNRPRPK